MYVRGAPYLGGKDDGIAQFFSQGPHSSHTEAVFNMMKMRRSGILGKQYLRRGELRPEGCHL